MAANWYYVDGNGQQVGPVELEAICSAYERKEIGDASLAWREGMAAWQPISQLAAELGLALAPSPPPASGWSTPTPPAPPLATGGDANPYRTPDTVSDDANYAGGGDVVYAGFWRRWAALFLDQLILAIPLFVVFFVLALLVGVGSMGGQPDPGLIIGLQLLFYVVWLAAALLYYAGLESSEAQATFGKRALGIKVTDLEGRRLSFKHAAGRWFAATLSYLSFYIGFLMAGLTERKQALHDYVASTLVVDKWAFTRYPEQQQRGLSGCLVIFIVFIVGSLLLIPIMFAVAIGAYADYERRARGASLDPPPGITAPRVDTRHSP